MGTSIVVVRVYVTESRASVKRLLRLLRNSGRLKGATVFRGTAGFGTTTVGDSDVGKNGKKCVTAKAAQSTAPAP